MRTVKYCAEKQFRNAALLFFLTAFVIVSFHSDVGAQDQSQIRERTLTRAGSVSSLPPQNKRWAILIGVDRYEDSNISPLKGAANDANEYRR